MRINFQYALYILINKYLTIDCSRIENKHLKNDKKVFFLFSLIIIWVSHTLFSLWSQMTLLKLDGTTEFVLWTILSNKICVLTKKKNAEWKFAIHLMAAVNHELCWLYCLLPPITTAFLLSHSTSLFLCSDVIDDHFYEFILLGSQPLLLTTSQRMKNSVC